MYAPAPYDEFASIEYTPEGSVVEEVNSAGSTKGVKEVMEAGAITVQTMSGLAS